jgi:hypothetical protein
MHAKVAVWQTRISDTMTIADTNQEKSDILTAAVYQRNK